MIAGDSGDDELVGGPGDDIFVFTPGDGDDTIRDFGNGNDKIDLTAFADIDSQNVLVLQQQGDNLVLNLPDDARGSIILQDFNIANLDASDFIF